MVTFMVNTGYPNFLNVQEKSSKHYKGFSKFLKIDKMIHLVIGSELLHLDNEEFLCLW